MKVFIYNQDDGTAAVCIPTGKLLHSEMRGRDFPDNAVMVNSEDLPVEHREFFAAWEVVDGAIEINVAKASTVAKDKIREIRVAKFVDADQVMLMAVEKGEALDAIAARKTVLRDFPARIDNAPTLPAMKSLIAQFEAL